MMQLELFPFIPVIYVNMRSCEVECCICEQKVEHSQTKGIPWFEEPVGIGESGGCYRAACQICYDDWDMIYREFCD